MYIILYYIILYYIILYDIILNDFLAWVVSGHALSSCMLEGIPLKSWYVGRSVLVVCDFCYLVVLLMLAAVADCC